MKNILKARTIFAFMFYAAFIYLIIMQLEIPKELNSIISILLGHYFGMKNKVDKSSP